MFSIQFKHEVDFDIPTTDLIIKFIVPFHMTFLSLFPQVPPPPSLIKNSFQYKHSIINSISKAVHCIRNV